MAPVTETPSLVNQHGYFYNDLDSLYQFAKPADVEKEIRAQILRAKQFGIDPTHLDAHMGCLFASAAFLEIIIKMGREFQLPVLLNTEAFKLMYNIDLSKYTTDKDIIADKVFMAQPSDFKNGMPAFYTAVLKSVQPGLNCILLHAAFDNNEMKAITIDHPDYGAAWRQADYDFFTSAACKNLLQQLNIKVITWKEIRDKLVRK